MSEMKIRMGEASFNYSPETAYEKNGNVYCNTCHEQINDSQYDRTWMCLEFSAGTRKRRKKMERTGANNALSPTKDTCYQ